MTTIDKSGESLEKIIKDFRNEYKIHDWELQYEILKKPSKGIFGLFAHKLALVRFQLPSSCPDSPSIKGYQFNGKRAGGYLDLLDRIQEVIQ